MAKFLKVVIILVVVLIVGIYFGSRFVFEAAADRFLPAVFDRLADSGINVVDYHYSSICFTSINTISANGVSAKMLLNKSALEKFNAEGYAEKLNIHIAHILNPAARLSIDNFYFKVEKAANTPGTTFGKFTNGYISFVDPIYLSDPKTGLKNMVQNISDLFQEKSEFPNAEIRALVTFNLRGKEAEAFLYTLKEAGASSLRFEENDIIKLAQTFDLELSDDEAAIIARYPLRAPAIMRITSDAKETSKNAYRSDRSVPEDAYRHVLWSYMLTQQFDADFAETVTNAHEVLPTNTAAERRMDFHNNRIGRRYAQQGVKRDRILWLVKNDRDVIRQPEDA